MPSLILLDDETGGRVFPITRSTLVMGSSESSGLQLTGDDIAPDHAVILRHGVSLVLQDSGSPSGTFVNGERVARVELTHGDVLRLGGYRFSIDTTEIAAEDRSAKETARLEVPGPRASGPVPVKTRQMVAVRAAADKSETSRIGVTVAPARPMRATARAVPSPDIETAPVAAPGIPVNVVIGIVAGALVVIALLVIMLLASR